MLSYREIVKGLQQLALQRQYPLIAHVSPLLIPVVRGGANTILGALLAVVDNAMLPSFTYRTLVIPETGPPDNALEYGSGRASNLSAEIFSVDQPADETYRAISETMRSYPGARRSSHPVLSFGGLGVNAALESQTSDQPYAPIKSLMEYGGMILLMGVDQSRNFSIHYAENLAGRKQFIRWSLTSNGILECLHFPGCPDGFYKLQYHIEAFKQQTIIADQTWQAYPLVDFIHTTVDLLKKDPFALLCNRLNCERCNAVRQAVRS